MNHIEQFPRGYGVSAITSALQGRRFALPLHAGVGLKPEHFKDILTNRPQVGFFEIHAENYLVAGGPFHHYLELIRRDYPLAVHGVGLSIGGIKPLDKRHLTAIKNLLDRYQPAVFSEHLAWSTHDGFFLNDLLPVPYDGEALNRICTHIHEIQDTLQRQILLENPSTYVEFFQSSYHEADFISEIACRTGCGLLLDVNNVYVSCTNHRWNIQYYLEQFPLYAVQQIHLAGFLRECEDLLIDSHGCAVDNAVWQLYESILGKIGPVPTLIEWDNNLPGLERLILEANKADVYVNAGVRSIQEPEFK